jgi:hypothetical protein
MIGWIALLMPWVVRIGAQGMQHLDMQASVSGYYYTDMRDVFVSTLVLVGILMTCNRTKRFWDNAVSIAAGIAAIAVGLIRPNPGTMKPQDMPTCPSDLRCMFPFLTNVHWICAAILFALLFVMVTFLFPRGTPADADRELLLRNFIYRFCGAVMLVCFVAIAIHRKSYFLPEAIAIFAFASAWLVKGQTILKDKPGAPRRLAV